MYHPEHQSPQFSVHSKTSEVRNESISIVEMSKSQTSQSQLESSVPLGLSVDRTKPASSTPVSHSNVLSHFSFLTRVLQDRVPTVKYTHQNCDRLRTAAEHSQVRRTSVTQMKRRKRRGSN